MMDHSISMAQNNPQNVYLIDPIGQRASFFKWGGGLLEGPVVRFTFVPHPKFWALNNADNVYSTQKVPIFEKCILTYWMIM